MERNLAIPVVLWLLTGAFGLAGTQESSAPASDRPSFDNLDAKIANLSQPGTTVEQAIQLLGPPEKYSWEGRTLAATNLPPVYLLNYPQGVSVFVSCGNFSGQRVRSSKSAWWRSESRPLRSSRLRS